MSKISVVIIAKNEEDIIADCIDSVSFCDEILLIDNGSDDKTVEIAQRMGIKVYPAKGKDFSAMRNIGIERAKGVWVLYVDADERIDEKLVESIKYKVLSKKKNDISAYNIRRKNFYLGNHEWPKIETFTRLFKKKAFKEWKGVLHETPYYDGKTEELEGFILHYTHRNLSYMLEKTITWSGIEAQLRYNANHPNMTWWRFPRVMFTAFWDSYIRQKGYTVGIVGLIESLYQSFSIFVTYARLWEMQQSAIYKKEEHEDKKI